MAALIGQEPRAAVVRRRSVEVVRESREDAHEQAGIEIVETAQKRGWSPDFDIERSRGRIREMAPVVLDNHLGVGANGCGQDMTVARIVRHRIDQRFETLDPRLRKTPPEFSFAPACFFRLDFPFLDKVTCHLVHDHLRPLRQIEPRLFGHPQEGIGERHGNENTRVEDDAIVGSHSSSPPSGIPVRSYNPDSNASFAIRSSAARRSASRRF
jgi:hypothetical protein